RICWAAADRLDERHVGELCRWVIHRGCHVRGVGGGGYRTRPRDAAEYFFFGNRQPDKSIVESALKPALQNARPRRSGWKLGVRLRPAFPRAAEAAMLSAPEKSDLCRG